MDAQAEDRNPSSVAMMQRLGMRLDRQWTDEEWPAVEYRLAREDWLRRGAR